MEFYLNPHIKEYSPLTEVTDYTFIQQLNTPVYCFAAKLCPIEKMREYKLKKAASFFISAYFPYDSSFEWRGTDAPRLCLKGNSMSSGLPINQNHDSRQYLINTDLRNSVAPINLKDGKRVVKSFYGTVFFAYERVWSEIPDDAFIELMKLVPKNVSASIHKSDSGFDCSLRDGMLGIAFSIIIDNVAYEFTGNEFILEIPSKKDHSERATSKCYLAIQPGTTWIISSLFSKGYATILKNDPESYSEFVKYTDPVHD